MLLKHSLMVLLPGYQVSSGAPLDLPLRLSPSPRSPWCRIHYGASHEGGISSSPAQSHRRCSTPSQRSKTCRRATKTLMDRHIEVQAWGSLKNHHRITTPSSHTLFRASLALHLTKLVLNLRIWSMSSLVGLENFSRVSVASHELQQPQMTWGEALYRLGGNS
jgi:hypothetical protein